MFGKKDYQQLLVLRELVRQLNFGVLDEGATLGTAKPLCNATMSCAGSVNPESPSGYMMHSGQVVYSGEAKDLLDNPNVQRLFLGEVPEEIEARLAAEETENA